MQIKVFFFFCFFFFFFCYRMIVMRGILKGIFVTPKISRNLPTQGYHDSNKADDIYLFSGRTHSVRTTHLPGRD